MKHLTSIWAAARRAFWPGFYVGWATVAIVALSGRTDGYGMLVTVLLTANAAGLAFTFGRRHGSSVDDESDKITVTTAEPYVRTTLPKDTPVATVLLAMGQAAKNMTEAPQ